MNNNRNWLDSVQRIHFIGIGGSGMSPLAEILHAKGYTLSGSDNNESDNLTRLRGLGISIVMGHSAANVDGADLVVYTAAIPADNPELIAAADWVIDLGPEAGDKGGNLVFAGTPEKLVACKESPTAEYLR